MRDISYYSAFLSPIRHTITQHQPAIIIITRNAHNQFSLDGGGTQMIVHSISSLVYRVVAPR